MGREVKKFTGAREERQTANSATWGPTGDTEGLGGDTGGLGGPVGAVLGPSKNPHYQTQNYVLLCSKCDTHINSFRLHSNPKRSENGNDPILQMGKLRGKHI